MSAAVHTPCPDTPTNTHPVFAASSPSPWALTHGPSGQALLCPYPPRPSPARRPHPCHLPPLPCLQEAPPSFPAPASNPFCSNPLIPWAPPSRPSKGQPSLRLLYPVPLSPPRPAVPSPCLPVPTPSQAPPSVPCPPHPRFFLLLPPSAPPVPPPGLLVPSSPSSAPHPIPFPPLRPCWLPSLLPSGLSSSSPPSDAGRQGALCRGGAARGLAAMGPEAAQTKARVARGARRERAEGGGEG